MTNKPLTNQVWWTFRDLDGLPAMIMADDDVTVCLLAPQAREEAAPLIESAPSLLRALVGLADYCNGRLGVNPYAVPEFEAACRAAARAVDHRGDWLVGIDAARRAIEGGPDHA